VTRLFNDGARIHFSMTHGIFCSFRLGYWKDVVIKFITLLIRTVTWNTTSDNSRIWGSYPKSNFTEQQ